MWSYLLCTCVELTCVELPVVCLCRVTCIPVWSYLYTCDSWGGGSGGCTAHNLAQLLSLLADPAIMLFGGFFSSLPHSCICMSGSPASPGKFGWVFVT